MLSLRVYLGFVGLTLFGAVGCASSTPTIASADDCLGHSGSFASLAVGSQADPDARLRDPSKQDKATTEARISRVIMTNTLSARLQLPAHTKAFADSLRGMPGVNARVVEYENLVRRANQYRAARKKEVRLLAGNAMQQAADSVATVAAILELNDIAQDTTLSTEQRATKLWATQDTLVAEFPTDTAYQQTVFETAVAVDTTQYIYYQITFAAHADGFEWEPTWSMRGCNSPGGTRQTNGSTANLLPCPWCVAIIAGAAGNAAYEVIAKFAGYRPGQTYAEVAAKGALDGAIYTGGAMVVGVYAGQAIQGLGYLGRAAVAHIDEIGRYLNH